LRQAPIIRTFYLGSIRLPTASAAPQILEWSDPALTHNLDRRVHHLCPASSENEQNGKLDDATITLFDANRPALHKTYRLTIYSSASKRPNINRRHSNEEAAARKEGMVDDGVAALVEDMVSQDEIAVPEVLRDDRCRDGNCGGLVPQIMQSGQSRSRVAAALVRRPGWWICSAASSRSAFQVGLLNIDACNGSLWCFCAGK
jgi:hypothetical protein